MRFLRGKHSRERSMDMWITLSKNRTLMSQCHCQRERSQPSPGSFCKDTHGSLDSKETHQWQQPSFKNRDPVLPPHLTSCLSLYLSLPPPGVLRRANHCPGGGVRGSPSCRPHCHPGLIHSSTVHLFLCWSQPTSEHFKLLWVRRITFCVDSELKINVFIV